MTTLVVSRELLDHLLKLPTGVHVVAATTLVHENGTQAIGFEIENAPEGFVVARHNLVNGVAIFDTWEESEGWSTVHE